MVIGSINKLVDILNNNKLVDMFNHNIYIVILTGIYTYLTWKLVKSEYGPKLYVYQNEIDKYEWDSQNININLEDIRQEGFSNWLTNNTNWCLTICNNGKAPAINIKVKFEVIFYKAAIFRPDEDKGNARRIKDVKHYKFKKSLVIDYLPPDEQKSYKIFTKKHRYQKACLYITKLYSKENSFIKKSVLLSEVYHIKRNFIQDPNDSRKMIGVQNDWES